MIWSRPISPIVIGWHRTYMHNLQFCHASCNIDCEGKCTLCERRPIERHHQCTKPTRVKTDSPRIRNSDRLSANAIPVDFVFAVRDLSRRARGPLARSNAVVSRDFSILLDLMFLHGN